MELSDVLKANNGELSDRDLAALADWAGTNRYSAKTAEWMRAYALLREGSDLLLRRRALQGADAKSQPKTIEVMEKEKR